MSGFLSTCSLLTCSCGLAGCVLFSCIPVDVLSICSLSKRGLTADALSVRILELLSADGLLSLGLTGGVPAICIGGLTGDALSVCSIGDTLPSCCFRLWSICFLCSLGLTVGALSVRILGMSSNCSLFSLGLTEGTLAIVGVALIEGTLSVCSIGLNIDVFSDCTLLSLGLTGGGTSAVGSVLPVVLLSLGISNPGTTVQIVEASVGTRVLACDSVAAGPLLDDKTFGSTSELLCNAVDPLVFLGFGTGFVGLVMLFIPSVPSDVTWSMDL